MLLLLGILGIISLSELFLWLGSIWQHRKVIAYLLMMILAVATGALVAERLATWTVLLSIFSLFRIINLSRVVERRVQADYLYHASRRTALWLIGCQLLIVGGTAAGEQLGLGVLGWWYLLGGVQLAGVVVLLLSTLRHLRTIRPPELTEAMAERNLPALTVAIPARNETEDLEGCLQSLVTSTYPKLEILVLDDCSQQRQTPEIIRSFAQQGVRFVAGTEPSDSWLAKNHAYAQLAAEANGELLLFCGVDVRFEPDSLSQLVKTMLQKHKSMVSVLPRNVIPRRGGLAPLFVQANRYAWELALPRRLLQRPPVLSTCWLITEQALEAAGGFQAIRRKAVPESYLARVVANQDDGYSFLRSDIAMGVTCYKSLVEQRATAIRNRYPQLHRRPELVVLLALAEFGLLVWPLVLLVAALLGQVGLLASISALNLVLGVTMYSKIISVTYRQFVRRGLWLLPVAALHDIGLLGYSMWQYEFSEVLWKGRNVCLPVMRVIPPRQFHRSAAQKS